MRFKKFDFFEFLLVVIYKSVLEFAYIKIIAVVFGYAGYQYSPTTPKLIAGWGLYFLTYFFIRSEYNRISDLFIYTYFFLSVAPFIEIYQYSSNCSSWMLVLQLVSVLLMNVIVNFSLNLKHTATFRKFPYDCKIVKQLALVSVFLFLCINLFAFGIPFIETLSWDSISQIRASADISLVINILHTLFCRIICPFVILVSWKEKKYIICALVMLVQFYVFILTGFKTYLFIPFLVVCVDILKTKNMKKIVLLGLSSSLLLTIILYLYRNMIMPFALIGDRVIFFPAEIKLAYFDFFSKNEFIHYSQNSFSRLFDIPAFYDTAIPNLIGKIYFNKPEMWTNTGFIADAYANSGVSGCIIISILLAFIIRVASNQFSEKNGKYNKNIQTLFLIYFIMLNDGPFISTFFSGGLLFLLLIVLFIDFSGKKDLTSGN